MSKKQKIIYYSLKGIFSAMIASGAIAYLVQPKEMEKEVVNELGFPAYLILFIAIAKIAGITAIWAKKSGPIMQWAYAGLFFELVLATSAHINAGTGEAAGAIVAIVLLLATYFTGKKHQA